MILRKKEVGRKLSTAPHCSVLSSPNSFAELKFNTMPLVSLGPHYPHTQNVHRNFYDKFPAAPGKSPTLCR